MAKAIDWHYHRKNCTSCGKAQQFLETNAIPPAPERIDARKVRYDRAEAIALARRRSASWSPRARKSSSWT